MEMKEFRSAQLYYNLEQYKAAALVYTNLLNNFPETQKGDEYKLMVIKAYYRYAKLSVVEKQVERFEKVIEEYQDFMDRFPDSKLLKEAEEYNNLSINHLKDKKNEQISSSAKR